MQNHQSSQQGAVLVVGLVLLLLLTIVGLSGARDAALQERMSGNMHDLQVARQAAEAALRSGEQFTRSSASLVVGSDGVVEFDERSGSRDYWHDTFNWLEKAVQLRADEQLEGVAEQPFYVIEKLDWSCDVAELGAGALEEIEVYRVTARGVGRSSKAEVFLQSIVQLGVCSG